MFGPSYAKCNGNIDNVSGKTAGLSSIQKRTFDLKEEDRVNFSKNDKIFDKSGISVTNNACENKKSKKSVVLADSSHLEEKDVNSNFRLTPHSIEEESSKCDYRKDTHINKISDLSEIVFVSLALMRNVIPIEDFSQLRKSFSFSDIQNEQMKALMLKTAIIDSQPIEIVLSDHKGYLYDATKMHFSPSRKLASLSPMQNLRSSPQQENKNMLDSTFDENESSEFGSLKCYWLDCSYQFDSVESLSRHVRKKHLSHLFKAEIYVCLWKGCKFYDQPSCSWKWLSKHVTRHCDLKPFKCVINGCDMAFVTQNGLARHVPTHFNECKIRRSCVQRLNMLQEPQKRSILADGDESADTDDESLLWKQQLQRANYKTFVSRKRPIKKDDPIDQATFKRIQGHLQSLCSSRTTYGFDGDLLKLQSKIIGKRSSSGKSEVMLHSYPEHVFSDCWIKAKNNMRPGDLLHSTPIVHLTHQQKCELYSKNSLRFRREIKDDNTSITEISR